MRNENTGIKFASRIFGFSMASWVNCIISLIATPITTAVFAPEELGKVNMLISYANIIIPFIYMGFDQAYVRFYNEPLGKNTSGSMFKLCLSFSAFLVVPTTLITIIMWKPISNGIVGYSSIFIFSCLILYVVATMLMRYANLKARMDNNIWLFFIQSVLSTIIIKISFACVALIKPSAEYAIFFRTALILLVGVIFVIAAIRKCRGNPVDRNRTVAKELLKYSIPLFPTIFIVMLNTSLSQLILKNYVEYEMIGIYSNAVTMASIITIVQSGLNTFWSPFVYEYREQRSKIQKMHHIISFLLITCGFGIIAFQDLVYFILVDESYWASKAIMGLLMISPIAETISETLGLGIELSKKTYMKLPVYIISIVVNILSCILLIPHFGIFGAAMANAISSLTMLIIKSVIGEHYYRCSDNYTKLILCMGLFIFTATLSSWFNNGYVKFIMACVGIIITTCVYYKTVVLLLKNLNQVKNKVFNKHK